MIETIRRIARERLGFNTLEVRNRDSLDFREVSCWQVERALRDAYEAGVASVTPVITSDNEKV